MAGEPAILYADPEQAVKSRVGDEPNEEIILRNQVVCDEIDGDKRKEYHDPAQVHERTVYGAGDA